MQGLSGVAYVRRKINLPRALDGLHEVLHEGHPALACRVAQPRASACWPGRRNFGRRPPRCSTSPGTFRGRLRGVPPSQASASRDGTRPVPLSASLMRQRTAVMRDGAPLPPETGLHRPFPARRSLSQHSLQPDPSWQHMRLPPPACRPAYQLQGASYWMPCSFPCFSSHIANIISVQTVRNATVVLWRRSNDSRHREHR